MGLSAWKVMLVIGVVALLFLPRFIRMGSMLKGLGQRFAFDGSGTGPQQDYGYGAADGRSPIIDGDTGLVVRPEPPAPRLSIPERIGLALARLVRRLTGRLSA